MPKPVSVVLVSVPLFAALSPASLTFNVSLSAPPFIVRSAEIELSVPFIVGASVEMLMTSLPASLFTVVTPLIVCTLTVSAPFLAFNVVVLACVLAMVKVSLPLPRVTFNVSSVP